MNQATTLSLDTHTPSRFTLGPHHREESAGGQSRKKLESLSAKHPKSDDFGYDKLKIILMLIATFFAVQAPSSIYAQNSDTIEDRTADIESAKASLTKINAAIDSGDFASAEPFMTEQGANEVAIWVTSFSMLLSDPEIGKSYPTEFDSVRDGLKQPLSEFGLDLELKSLGSEAVQKTLAILDKDDQRWNIVGKLWAVTKAAPMELILIRGPVQRSAYAEDAVFLQVARQADGDAKKFDAGAAPSVAKFVKEDNAWKFDGLDGEKTASLKKLHDRKLAQMPPKLTDPSFEGKTPDGEVVTFEQYAGKVVVIDFWGTWCSPCLAKLPALKKIREAFEPHGFEIVGIASDTAEDLQAYLKKNPLPWKNVVDNGEIQTQFGVKGYPTLFLVNQEKQNVANNLELDKLIDAIAKELNLPLEDFADLKSEVAEMMAGVPH